MANRPGLDFHINSYEFVGQVSGAMTAFANDVRGRLPIILEMIGTETIAHLRSLTGETRPPARKPGGKMTGTRAAHPGGWADITGDLARAYDFEVVREQDSFTLVLRNTMEYAVYLEARDGFFVLSGVTDKGGPVERALQRIVPVVAPGWTVRVA